MKFRGRPLDDEFLRIRIVLALMLIGFVVLGARLWSLQVARSAQFAQRQEQQSIRRVRLPGTRGRLLDREERVLADNRPSFSVVFYLEELRKPGPWSKTIEHVEALIQQVGTIIGQPSSITRADIQSHIRRRLPLPLVAWRDLDEQSIARVSEQAAQTPGMEIRSEAVRVYPFRDSACHLLGYVGRADLKSEEQGDQYHYFLDEMIGRAGLEKTQDALLRGQPGGRLLRVDVTGYRRQDVYEKPPVRGDDVMLSLDERIQRLAEEALGDAPGAVVVVDPRNGDVLALASSPRFDPNKFVPAIRTADWALLKDDPLTPLLNRAVAGAYAPGSTFKPITALAALEAGKAHVSDEHDCPGYFMLGKTRFGCWQNSGHGRVDFTRSIAQSCNVAFFEMGLGVGPERIQTQARDFGLGRKTGLPVDYESPGLIPDAGWKRMTQGEGWRDGDTCNMSIGQGAVTVTPLQMAMVASVIGNQGKLYRPRLILATRSPDAEQFAYRPVEKLSELKWKGSNLEYVRQGMREVVMSDTGSGRKAMVPGVVMAAKTGSAEFGPRDARKIHAWMIAFAPYDAPRYAVALVVDEGVSGGTTVAPRLKKLFSGLFNVSEEKTDEEGVG